MVSIAAPGEAARPALALVNSRRNNADGPVDELATRASLGTWLAGQGLVSHARVDDAALAAVRELRGAVRELLEARIAGRVPGPAAVETVNAAAAGAPTVRRLTWTDPDTPREERYALGAGGAALACARAATTTGTANPRARSPSARPSQHRTPPVRITPPVTPIPPLPVSSRSSTASLRACSSSQASARPDLVLTRAFVRGGSGMSLGIRH